MKIIKDLKYSKEHEWFRIEGNIAYIGITDFAQEQLGDIVFVELPQIGDEFAKGDSIASIESVKASAEIFTEVSGKVVEVNTELEDEPGRINEKPYENYLVAIEMEDPSELDDLMDSTEYKEFIKED